MSEHSTRATKALGVSIIFAALIAAILTTPSTALAAVGDVEYETIGNGEAGVDNTVSFTPQESVRLFVADGSTDIAAVTVEVNVPLNETTDLVFVQQIINATAPFGANVILGIDTDGDGYEADHLAWHIGDPHNPAALGDDTFIELDGVPVGNSTWEDVDALDVAQWWGPDLTGSGFDTCYSDFETFLNDCTGSGHRADATDTIATITLLIGGSTSWNDLELFVDDLQLNGVTILSPADTDGDGILDANDNCPTEAETANGFEDEDGCPDTEPEEEEEQPKRNGHSRSPSAIARTKNIELAVVCETYKTPEACQTFLDYTTAYAANHTNFTPNEEAVKFAQNIVNPPPAIEPKSEPLFNAPDWVRNLTDLVNWLLGIRN